MGYLILILCLYVVLMFVSCFVVCKEDKPMITNSKIVAIKSEDASDYYFMCCDEHVTVERKTGKMDGVTLIFNSRDELEMIISKLELLRAKTIITDGKSRLSKMEAYLNDKVN